MRVIIIGASGTIGRNLYDVAATSGLNVIGTYNKKEIKGLVQYDMQIQSLESVISKLCSDDVVYLLSAYSNPSWIFEHQDKARALNLHATKKLIDEISESGARIIFMSSVEVFDGKSGNYNEQSLPNPLNLYGQMKYEIETHLIRKKVNSCIVRTGWNVGWTVEHRCVIKLTYETLLRPEAKMAKDNIFSIIDVQDTVAGLLKLINHPTLRMCHIASAPPILRTELADTIMSFSKYKDKMSYKTVSFSDINYSEPRSRCNQLDNSLAVSLLDMKFKPPKDIIKNKVELLDRMQK